MATLSQNITQAISDLDSIKTAIRNKGVTVSANTPTSDYAGLIGNIPSGDDSVLKGIIQRTVTSIDIPQGTTSIAKMAFYTFSSLTSVLIPNGITSIGDNAFGNCTNLSGVTIPGSVTSIGNYAFTGCTGIVSVTIAHGVKKIGNGAFQQCSGVTSLSIPNTITNVLVTSFQCHSLVNVTIENGFNANNLKLSDSTLYSASTIVSWLNALADRTGLTAYTLTIGATNLDKLTATEIAIATNKNWNLA